MRKGRGDEMSGDGRRVRKRKPHGIGGDETINLSASLMCFQCMGNGADSFHQHETLVYSLFSLMLCQVIIFVEIAYYLMPMSACGLSTFPTIPFPHPNKEKKLSFAGFL
jgi:hypothetical protein